MTKVLLLNDKAFAEALQSHDPQRRGQVYKALLKDDMIKATIRKWIQFYNPKNLDLEDVLQDSIILLDKALLSGQFKFDSKVRTFLLGICKNVIRSGARRVSRIQFKETISDADLFQADDFAEEIILVEHNELELQRDNLVQEALEQLTEKCKDALQLYYYQNKSMAQVAEDRGLANAEQAKKAVHRCREKLREELLNNPNLLQTLNQLQ